MNNQSRLKNLRVYESISPKEGEVIELKAPFALPKESLDATFMSVRKLRSFLKQQVSDSKLENLLFSLHMKATMMKVSDPIIFGHAVSIFFESVFEAHSDLIKDLGVNVRNGFGDLISKLEGLAESDRERSEFHSASVVRGPSLLWLIQIRG